MQRTRPDDEEETKAPTQRPKVKRTKRGTACEQCRKAKCRCEPNPRTGRCRRCTILYATCSLEIATPPIGASESGTPSLPDSTPLPSISPDRPTRPLQAPDLHNLAAALEAVSLNEPPLMSSPPPRRHQSQEEMVDYMFESVGTMRGHFPPMTAMSELIGLAPEDPLPAGNLLHGIGETEVGLEELRVLLDLFDLHYLPWLHLPPFPSSTLPSLDEFSTVARCAVAARHLPAAMSASTLATLQQRAAHTALVHTVQPAHSPSVGTALALLVLGMWPPPHIGGAANVQGGAQLVHAAAEMGAALGLDQAEERLKKFDESAEDRSSHEREVVWFETQLWFAILNADFMLTTGNPVPPVHAHLLPTFVQQPLGANNFFSPHLFLGKGTPDDLRVFRLRLALRLHALTQAGLQLRICELRMFARDMEEALHPVRIVREWLAPLRVTLAEDPHTRKELDALLLIAHWNVLVLLCHALTQIRAFAETVTPGRAWLHAVHATGVPAVLPWGFQFVDAAQAALMAFVALAEHEGPMSSVAAAPDALAPMVLFAAGCLVIGRYAVYVQFEGFASPAPWLATGGLLTRVEGAMSGLCGEGAGQRGADAMRRAARAVGVLRRKWDATVVKGMLGSAGPGKMGGDALAAVRASLASSDARQPVGSQLPLDSGSSPALGVPVGGSPAARPPLGWADAGSGSNLDGLLGGTGNDAFWDAFISGLSGGGTNPNS